jgi:ribosomal protein L16 Arg81 hydroxylase
VDVAEFLAETWERAPLVVQRREPRRFADLLSSAAIERLLTAENLRYPAFRLVKAGEQPRMGDYTVDISWRPVPLSGSPDVERIAAEWERGATIVLQALHVHWPPLATLCRELETALGHPVQANAYYTPRASQGLAVHHDTHDVFVLQVEGRKRWLVYEPVLDLPLKDQKYTPEMGGPGDPVHDVTLAPGDTLYLPRGWLHEALTSDTDSLHITVGVTVHTWLAAVRAALDECADEVAFRRSVPADGVPDEDLVAALQARLEPDAVRRRMRERFVQTRRPLLEGQLTNVRSARTLDTTTPLELRPTVIADVHERADAVVLLFHGKEVRFPPHVAEDLQFIVESDSLDEAGRLVLARRLVREGLLVVSRPGGSDGSSPRNGAAAGA